MQQVLIISGYKKTPITALRSNGKQSFTLVNSLVSNWSKPCSRSFLLATGKKSVVFLDTLISGYKETPITALCPF